MCFIFINRCNSFSKWFKYCIGKPFIFLPWIFGLGYFFFNFFIAWIFGKKDYEYLPLNDIGFRFHIITYFLFNIVSILWFLFGFHSKYESLKNVYYIALFWGVGLLIHFKFYLVEKNNSIKGLRKEDIFE